MKITDIIQERKVDNLDEGWKDQLFGLGLAGAVAAGSTGVMTAKQALTSPNQTKPVAAVAQNTQPAKPQLKKSQPTAPAKVVEPTVNYITNTPLEKYLMTYATKAGLRGYELAQFMAQCAHETQDFSRLAERGSPQYFRKYDPKYAPKKAKILGNTKVGDGTRFKGRGFIQLTGRYNYGVAGKAIGQDLIKNPQLAENPKIAAQIALWYWQNRVKPSVDDYKNTTDVTRKINPGLKGLEDRHENFIEYIAGDETDSKNVNEQGVAEGFIDKFFKPKKVKPEMIMNIKKGNGELYVEVYMGEDSTYWIARFTFDMIGDTLTAQDISVTDEYRGRGIAKWVYDTLKNKGYTINRSPYQTDDGKHFWDKNKGANAKVWEQGVAEGLEHNSQDLDDVADWMNTTPDKLSVTVKQEPIEKFIKQIREMYGTYDEFPEDKKRTNRILKLLKRGAKPLPIYVEANDPYLFVMEGRHRMVAFWLEGMKTIPVAYVSINSQQGVTEGLEQDIPEFLYHATYRPLLKSIKQHGLGGDKAQAKWEDSKPGVVYLATDPNVAESYAETSDVVPDEWLDQIVILKISTNGLENKIQIDRNVQDNEGDTLEYHGIIPLSNISMYKQGVAEGLEQEFEFELDTEKGRLNVYNQYGGPAGRIEFYPTNSKTINIDLIIVQPQYQRKGLGTQMFNYLKDRGYTIKRPTELTPDGKKFFGNLIQKGIAEDQTEDDNITVQNNVETSFRGGYGGTLIAKTPERQVGYLNYSIYNDKPQIGMIFVAQDYRRRGVAMKMLKALQELSPNEEIDWGITTDAGSNLRKSVNYRKVPNPEIIKKKAKLAGVRSKLARLNYRLEQLKNTDVELARKFVQTVDDRWNQLNDLEYRLENELYLNKGEYSKLIPEEVNGLYEKWSQKYKSSINCNNPKGFSQRAHCQGRKKNEDTVLERKRKRSRKKAYGFYGYYPIYSNSEAGAEGGGEGG